MLMHPRPSSEKSVSRRLVIAFKFYAQGRGPMNRGRTGHGKLVAQAPKAIAEPLQVRDFLAKSRLARDLSHLELTGSRFHLDLLARVVPVGTATRAQEVEPTGLRSRFYRDKFPSRAARGFLRRKCRFFNILGVLLA